MISMNILSILKKYIPRLLRRMNRPFKVPVEKQKKYLKSFPEPQDDFERAYFQYKCQVVFWGFPFHIAASCVAAILLPLQFHKFKKLSKMKSRLEKSHVDLIMVADEMPEGIFQDSLLNEYESKKLVGSMDNFNFDKYDVEFYNKLKNQYRFSPYFLYKCLMKMAGYSYLIAKYEPTTIAACGGEFTFTSSLLTSYCNSKGIQHYNVMHGEMFYYILDSFCHFNRFYVWDEHYQSLLGQLRAKADAFIIELPKSVFIDMDAVDVEGLNTYDFKYYLQLQEGDKLKCIAETMLKLKNLGYDVCVRYHPRTINIKEIESLFVDIDIEKPSEISIEKSIKSTQNIIGLNSTVLFQTYVSGGNAIMDDVSDKQLFKKLEKLDYILMKKGCKRLSEFI